MTNLFEPLRVGDLTLPNRVVMAPLTRLRAGSTHTPNALMAEYYGQRASAGLLITEGVPVTPQGVGYAGVPGIWSDTQTQAWKQVTKAVHDKGGRIFMQIWHVGRISDPSHLNGELPVGPSAIAAAPQCSKIRADFMPSSPKAKTKRRPARPRAVVSPDVVVQACQTATALPAALAGQRETSLSPVS